MKDKSNLFTLALFPLDATTEGQQLETKTFSMRLVDWQKKYGRHHLPWQNTHNPYYIWLSEIMLQQTQVAAVIPYFQRFICHLPTVACLAAATQETVLSLWSGLGYYSRARHLHHAAQWIMQENKGVFPRIPTELILLAGVGRSTAAAIAAFAFGERAAILDGNVKRVLARHAGVIGFTGDKKIETQLWSLAEARLPLQQDIVAYTQGLMDLGSTVCTRSRPKCSDCPVAEDCVARLSQQTAVLPTPRPKKQQPEKQVAVMLFYTDSGVFLTQRPQKGIWAGLWSLPEYAAYSSQPIARLDTQRVVEWLAILLQEKESLVLMHDCNLLEKSFCIKHTFTHFNLFLNVYLIPVNTLLAEKLAAHLQYLPYAKIDNAPLPSPIRAILQQHYAELINLKIDKEGTQYAG